MIKLLNEFSVDQIALFVVMLAVAVKGISDFFDWIKNKYQKKFNNDYDKKKEQEAVEKQINALKEKQEESIQGYARMEQKFDSFTEKMNEKVDKIESQLELLTESDMHDIKGWIVEKHHALMKQKWVDDFTMDTLEKRYADYKRENGNSYVAGLMSELRALPHFSDQD